jgi:hypothetical protein
MPAGQCNRTAVGARLTCAFTGRPDRRLACRGIVAGHGAWRSGPASGLQTSGEGRAPVRPGRTRPAGGSRSRNRPAGVPAGRWPGQGPGAGGPGTCDRLRHVHRRRTQAAWAGGSGDHTLLRGRGRGAVRVDAGPHVLIQRSFGCGFCGGWASRTYRAGPQELRQRDTSRPGRLGEHLALLWQEADSNQGRALPGLRPGPRRRLTTGHLLFHGSAPSWSGDFHAPHPTTREAHGGITAPACRGGYTAVACHDQAEAAFWVSARCSRRSTWLPLRAMAARPPHRHR